MLAVLLGVDRVVTAQAVLERIESQIRTESGQPGAPAAAVKTPAAGKAYLGAMADDKNSRGRGVLVLNVRPGGPSDRAGLRADDLIVSASGGRVRQMSDLTAVLDMMSPGDKLVLGVVRGTAQQSVEITLGQYTGAAAPRETTPPVAGEPALVRPNETTPAAPALTGPGLQGPSSDSARVEQLQRRVEQLERRVEELEKALSASRR
jgi:hypothetical protein